jgi:hypothetical protein
MDSTHAESTCSQKRPPSDFVAMKQVSELGGQQHMHAQARKKNEWNLKQIATCLEHDRAVDTFFDE